MYKSHNPPKKLTLLGGGVYNGIVYYKIGDFMRRIRRKKEKQKKKIIIISAFLFLIIMTSGYAAFSTNISLHAKGNIKCNPKIVKEKFLENLTTTGDGLYIDEYEEGRYVYKGVNPNNYLKFNDELWRIVSLENDGTIKIYKEELLNQAFDNGGYRDSNSNGAGGTYCALSSTGCNAWAATSNLVGTPAEFKSGNNNGTVLLDASINTYLNDQYYQELSSDKNYIVSHNFNVGPITWYQDSRSISDVITDWSQTESEYIWNGKIGLLSVVDILKANTEKTTCIMEKNESTFDPDQYDCHLNTYIRSQTNMFLINPRFHLVSVVGRVKINDATAIHSDNTFAVSFYLDSNIKLCGLGTKNNPYEIE